MPPIPWVWSGWRLRLLGGEEATIEPLTVVVAGVDEYIDEAAEIWAEATSARDGDVEVPPLHVSRRLIETVLDSSPRSLLLVAVGHDGRAVGFAAVQPVSTVDEPDDEVRLRYLGVRPDAWGRGVAAQLLVALRARLEAAGCRRAQLGVYVDNFRAIALYERLGWSPFGRAAPHPRSGRLEQEYRLDLRSCSGGRATPEQPSA